MVCGDYAGGPPGADRVLVVGAGGDAELAAHAGQIREWLRAGGRLVSLTLSGEEAGPFLPFAVETTSAEHICTTFPPPAGDSPLAGIGPADVHNRDPRQVELVSRGAEIVGNGVLAVSREGNVVFCQLVPWQFDYGQYYNQKRTFRRTACLLTRVLSNMGVPSVTPLLERFAGPAVDEEQRYLAGLYLEQPEEFDDPYRYFRW